MRGRISYVEGYGWDPLPILDDAYELDLVHRHLEPDRWRRLFRLEVLAWGGALLIHLGALALWWTHPGRWSR